MNEDIKLDSFHLFSFSSRVSSKNIEIYKYREEKKLNWDKESI